LVERMSKSQLLFSTTEVDREAITLCTGGYILVVPIVKPELKRWTAYLSCIGPVALEASENTV
jgi:hypothetical protein